MLTIYMHEYIYINGGDDSGCNPIDGVAPVQCGCVGTTSLVPTLGGQPAPPCWCYRARADATIKPSTGGGQNGDRQGRRGTGWGLVEWG